jgi:hypothetical protein
VPRDEAALSAVVERLKAWFDALEQDLGVLKNLYKSSRDVAAESYASLLEAVLAEHRSAFLRLAKDTEEPFPDRLRRLQHLGGEFKVLVTRLERLDGAMPPRSSPLIAAYVRLLSRLAPDVSAVFTPFRQLNYELLPVASEDFVDYELNLQGHRFPVLFVRIPTGFLDSPRNHILVAHELGHAVAAVRQEEVDAATREAVRVTREGGTPPAPVRPLYTQPTPPRDRVEDVVNTSWSEAGLQVPERGSTREPEYLAHVAAVQLQAQEMAGRWLEELFADSVATYLFGPAFVFAFFEVLLPLDPLELASESHPATAARILNMRATLDTEPLGGVVDQLPRGLSAKLGEMLNAARQALFEVPGDGLSQSTRKLFLLVGELVASVEGEVRTAAATTVGELAYTPDQFRRDKDAFVSDLVHRLVPPLTSPPAHPVSLATIFNVGQLVALEHIDEFRAGEPLSTKWRELDKLLLKAIELSEVQSTWSEVPALSGGSGSTSGVAP